MMNYTYKATSRADASDIAPKKKLTWIVAVVAALIGLVIVSQVAHIYNYYIIRHYMIDQTEKLTGVRITYDKISGFYKDDPEHLYAEGNILTLEMRPDDLNDYVSQMKDKYTQFILPIEDEEIAATLTRCLKTKDGYKYIDISGSGECWIFSNKPEMNYLSMLSGMDPELAFIYIQPDMQESTLKIWYQFYIADAQEQ